MSMPTGALHCPSDGTALPVGPESRVGMVLHNRYRIERFVGRGRHGDVYFARHTTVGRAVAIKALRRELTQDPTAVARFVQEAQSVAALGHPNVVEVTDAGELPDRTPYIVMEWLDGESLAQYARRVGPLPPTRAAEIVAAIAAGLGACHAIGVIHRDLKPENVILHRTTRGEVPKILDFGLARVMHSDKKLTQHGAVVGDFRYAAPEQLAAGPIDARVDVHALGCVFFELVVGRPPQRGGEPMAPALQSFAPVAARAFATSRDARYASMEELRTALTEAANGTSASFTPAEALAAREAAVKVRRTWLLPVVLATFVVLVGSIFTLSLVMLEERNQQNVASAGLPTQSTPLSPPPLAAPPIVAPTPTVAPTLSTTIRLEAREGVLEVRRGEQRLGDTPLSIARPRGDETLSLTLFANGQQVESVVIDARSPETFHVGPGTSPATQGTSHLGAPPRPEQPVAPTPMSEHSDTPEMLDPWE